MTNIRRLCNISFWGAWLPSWRLGEVRGPRNARHAHIMFQMEKEKKRVIHGTNSLGSSFICYFILTQLIPGESYSRSFVTSWKLRIGWWQLLLSCLEENCGCNLQIVSIHLKLKIWTSSVSLWWYTPTVYGFKRAVISLLCKETNIPAKKTAPR
jgi:hypothetical protein